MFYADSENNDANILKAMLKDSEGLQKILMKGDQLVLDRGFRDAADMVRSKGFNVSMPSFLSPKSKQFTTKEANETRRVTMVRWIVEAINGRQKKKYPYFANVIRNSNIPTLNDDFRRVP